jgi:hypothetical protein
MPISSEPAPSYRPWTFTAGATLLRTAIPYHDTFRRLGKTGTFYFAQNRNFLLCVDNPPNSALGSKAAGFPITRDHPITGSPDSSA